MPGLRQASQHTKRTRPHAGRATHVTIPHADSNRTIPDPTSQSAPGSGSACRRDRPRVFCFRRDGSRLPPDTDVFFMPAPYKVGSVPPPTPDPHAGSILLPTQQFDAGVSELTGFEDEHTRDLILANKYLRQTGVASLRPLLPLLLRLKGKPYRLHNYFPFEPFFRTRMAKTVLLKTGRQVSKSTSLAAQGVVFSNSRPYFSTLYVTPLFEMIRRFSHNYVREFIDESPVSNLFTGTKTTNQILQRSFKNGSAMYFSYAFLDAERTRGIPADKNVIDEVQDMNYDFLQIIHETLSGSPYALKQYAGTPKSLDNTIEKLWEDSSQAEWMIKCHHPGCGHWNVPAADWDLWEMIGPWHRDISEACPGVVCGPCQKPINPRAGRWVHRYPEKRWSFAGYHVPQIIMPMHYANQEKWDVLKGKQEGRSNTTPTTFLNEVCGESCDSGSKLLTKTDIMNACVLPWASKMKDAVPHIKKYVRRVLAVDWGGGGGAVKGGSSKGGEQKRNRTSFTTLAVMGVTPDGKTDVIWGHRSVRTHDWEYEARLCLEAMTAFKCSHIAHDYSNAGEGRLVLLYQAGLPESNIINMRYQGFGHNIMNYHQPTEDNPHPWYAIDKSRSLVTTCMCVKHGLIRFFKYDYVSADQVGLLEDFLALVEEKVDSRLGSDAYVITRNPNKPDDFAHSVNMGACCLWWLTKKWPNVAEAAKFKITRAQMQHMHPVSKVDWSDL